MKNIADLVNDMWAARAVAAVAQLGIPDALQDGPKKIDQVAKELQLDPQGLFRLARVVSGVGILEFLDKETISLTEMGLPLCKNPPEGMLSFRYFFMATSLPGHWLPWGDLESAVRTNRSSTEKTLGAPIWEYYRTKDEERVVFSNAMSNFSTVVIPAVLAHYTFPEEGCIVDVGGSHGSLLLAILEKYPKAKGIVFDLKEVIETAPALAPGLEDRVELFAGNFFDGPVPDAKADIYLLKHILHDWNDEKCKVILNNIRKVASAQSKLLIIEHVLQDGIQLGQRDNAAIMDLNMLVMCDGQERTVEEFTVLCKGCGFKFSRTVPMGPLSILEFTVA